MRSVLARRILVTASLVGACALCFGRLTIHPRDMLVGPQNGGANDLTEYFQPLRVLQIQSWRRYGQWPAWDHHLQLGRPLAGNPQTAFFYPVNWAYFALGPGAVSWIMVLHHLLAGWGMYLLCRRYEFAPLAATVGGAVFLAAPYFVAHTAEGHYSMTCAAAWIPWALLCYERLRRGKRYSLPLTALVLAMTFLCGSAQIVFYLVAVLCAFWVVDLIRQSPEVLRRRELALRWAGVGALTLGLAAVEFGPIWLASKQTVRGRGSFSVEGAGGADWDNLKQLHFPFALGDPASMQQDGRSYWETLISFGAAPLALAMGGAIFRWRHDPVRRYAVLLLFALIFALGSTTPLYTALHNAVPGVAKFQIPTRIMYLASAAVAVMAAAGAHDGLRWLKEKSWAKRLGVSGTIALSVMAIVELTIYGILVTRTIPPDGLRSENPLAERLAGSSGAYRVLIDNKLLSTQETFHHDVAKVRGYEPFRSLGFAATYSAAIGRRSPLPGEVAGYATDPQLRYADGPLDLMGVRYAAVAHHEQIEAPEWTLIERGRIPARVRLRGDNHDPQRATPYALYENTNALPRAFVLGHTKVVRFRDASAVSTLTKLNPREQLLVESDHLTSRERQAFRPATIVEQTPSRVVVKAEFDAPGYLVLSQMHAVGWKATVDRQEKDILPVNLAFIGVPLSAGKHVVEFSYHPPLLVVGGLISLMGLAVAGLLLWQDFRPNETQG